MDQQQQQGKNIGIFGLGITGVSVYLSLVDVTNEVICYDDSQINRDAFIAKFGDRHLLNINDERWTSLDQIVISPGIPHSHVIFQIAEANGIPISSDIELFIKQNPESEFIMVTGTNGKSTVIALTGHILAKAQLNYIIGGNIGIPVMSLPHRQKGYILELSSFQIELLNKIDPKIAVLTNITPDHLDRYETLEEYAKVKEQILTSNALKIIGVNSDISQNIYDKLKKIYGSKLIPVSNTKALENGIFCNDNYLQDNYFAQQKYKMPELPYLRGIHNKENIAISYAISRLLGVPSQFIIEALESFKGLEHRMEYIGKYQNIDFYNDSKATNVSSALASLSAFNKIIWFAGGKFKENSFTEFNPILKNIKKAYLFGESKDLFANFLDSKVEYEICTNLEEAFDRAIKFYHKTQDGLTFLLAPACASYDQFKNFEERGKLFVKLVQKLLP